MRTLLSQFIAMAVPSGQSIEPKRLKGRVLNGVNHIGAGLLVLALITSEVLADELEKHTWIECMGMTTSYETGIERPFHILRVFDEDNVQWFDGKNGRILDENFHISPSRIMILSTHWIEDLPDIITMDRFTGEYKLSTMNQMREGICQKIGRPKRKF